MDNTRPWLLPDSTWSSPCNNPLHFTFLWHRLHISPASQSFGRIGLSINKWKGVGSCAVGPANSLPLWAAPEFFPCVFQDLQAPVEGEEPPGTAWKFLQQQSLLLPPAEGRFPPPASFINVLALPAESLCSALGCQSLLSEGSTNSWHPLALLVLGLRRSGSKADWLINWEGE